MDLLERYLAEVERHLPRGLRADVSRELRSSIEDALDAKTGDTGAGRNAAALDVLKEYGRPADIARSYLPQRYVVGPRFYDSFWSTVKITLLVVAGLVALGLTLDLVAEGTSLRSALIMVIETVGEFPATAVTLLGIITVVFIVIERVSGSGESRVKETGAWDPTTLPEIEDTTRINRASHAVDACFYVGLFVFFNFYREYVGILNHTNGEWWFMPLGGSDFGPHLLWLNLWWAASLTTTIFILRAGRWLPWTRAAKLLLAVLLAVILYRMSQDPGLVGLPADWPGAYRALEPEQKRIVETVAPVAATMARIGLKIAAVGTAIGAVTGIVRASVAWARR